MKTRSRTVPAVARRMLALGLLVLASTACGLAREETEMTASPKTTAGGQPARGVATDAGAAAVPDAPAGETPRATEAPAAFRTATFAVG